MLFWLACAKTCRVFFTRTSEYTIPPSKTWTSFKDGAFSQLFFTKLCSKVVKRKKTRIKKFQKPRFALIITFLYCKICDVTTHCQHTQSIYCCKFCFSFKLNHLCKTKKNFFCFFAWLWKKLLNCENSDFRFKTKVYFNLSGLVIFGVGGDFWRFYIQIYSILGFENRNEKYLIAISDYPQRYCRNSYF